jgi:hypothetical protein
LATSGFKERDKVKPQEGMQPEIRLLRQQEKEAVESERDAEGGRS